MSGRLSPLPSQDSFLKLDSSDDELSDGFLNDCIQYYDDSSAEDKEKENLEVGPSNSQQAGKND